uniref:L1 transposable element RRM domain-containing protein n=1 Tax=Knipowitschia caucasica TaxID=637954 RepID=A0AAV2L1E9_KNICA
MKERTQRTGETAEGYIRTLHELADTCAFGEVKEENIRDRLVIGILDKDLSEKLQMMPDLTLNRAVELVRQSEQVKQHKSDSHDKKLEEICITTCATESKLVDIACRISNVEGCLGFLEDAQERLEAFKEVEVLREKLDDVENRERRCNLRFVGFPESCENNDAVAFLEGIIPTLFDIDFAKGLEIDRAHRLGAIPRRQDGDQSTRPRAIIARFLRFQDRERIAEAARKKGNVIWGGRRIMVFPDYSRMLNEKRAKFKDCKKLLHDKNICFSLNYPAVLVVKTAQGPMRFEDHKRAISFIHLLN